MDSTFSHRVITSSLVKLRSVRWRKWITFIQDHSLSRNRRYWDANKDTGPICDFRQKTHFLGSQIENAEVSRYGATTERHFENLDRSTQFPFRFFWFVPVFFLAGWSLYTPVVLDEWGQFIAQLVVWSRNISLSVARMRYENTTGWIIFKFYEDRVVGDLPALTFYTIVSRPSYRYLYDEPANKWVVGGVTGVWLLLVTFWEDFYILGRFLWWKSRSSRERSETNTVHYRAFKAYYEKFLRHIRGADVDDAMLQHFLRIKRSGRWQLRTMECFVPERDVEKMPRYETLPKVPIFIMTAVLQAQALYATRKNDLFFSITLGWAIWIMARISFCVFMDYISMDDTSSLFSFIGAGTLILLPLTASMALTDNAVLEPLWNKVALGIGLVAFVNLFSNLLGTLCEQFVTWLGETI